MTGENDRGSGKTAAALMLRKRAEAKVAAGNKSFPDMSASEMSTLIHELRIHQVELEMQNEELRKSQAETERSRKAYQDLWELSPVGYLIVDFAGRVTAVNCAAQRLFGKPEDAILKERFSMLVAPEKQVPVHLMFERVAETGSVEKQEIRILQPGGAIHICLLEVRSLRGQPGREQIQAILTDITQQKQAEDDLKKKEQEKIAILDSLVEHVVYQDREMKILWANRAACESVQMKREDLLGRNCHEVWADRRSPCEDCSVIKARETGQPQQVEKMTTDGRWWYIQGHPVRDHNGHDMGTTEITLDITDRKRAEEKLSKAKDELELRVEQRNAELVETNDKLRQEIEERKRVEKDLHETKNLLSNTFNALQDSVVVIDKDLRVRMSNWKGHDYISQKDRQGYPFCYEVIMNRKKPCSPCHATEVFATGEIKQLEATNPIDGKIRDIRALPMFDDKGKVVAVIEHLRDITELKQAEKTLSENEEKYRQLFENESDAVMIFDAETGRFEDANQATIDLYGYSKDEFLTLKVEDISAEKEKTRSNVKRIRDGGAFPKQVPLRYFKKKDDTVFPGEIGTGRFIIEGRKKIIGAVRDITERIRAEEAMRDSEKRYRHLVDCARDIIYIVSSDATILSMNPAIENMTGWSPSECTDKHLASFVHPDDFPLAMEMGQRALQGDKPPIHELRILSKSGKYVLGEFSIAPFIQRGSVVGILGVGRDITIRKKLEKALKNQAHKLFQRVKELNCLFGISELLVKPGQSLDQILQGIVDLIPLGWQYPEITCAKLDLHEKIYATKNFKETIWKQAWDIYVHGDLSGTLKVCYLEEKPSRDDEPFLKEEKKLLKSIAERVGKIVEGKQAREALQESEQRFHGLFNNMSSGVAVYKAVNDGEDFIFVDFNKASERIDNIKKEALIGKSLLEVYPGVKEFGFFDVLQRVWRTGKPEHHPVSFYQSGRIRGWRENYVYGLPSGEIVAVYDDITERIQAQEALRESEARYRALSEATFEAIFISEKGVCLDTNQGTTELFGYDYDELIGIFGTHVIAPESKELVKRHMLSGYEEPYEAIAQKKDGTKFDVEIRGKMMRYKDKDVRITVIRDIDEQKRAVESLRKSEKRYRDLFNSIPIGLYRSTPEGSILDVNPAVLEILGYPDRNTLLQLKSLEIYADPDDRKQLQRLLEEKGFVHGFAVRLCRHDGSSVWVSISAAIVHDTDSQITYYEGAMADISQRKASEERIHQLSQQLIGAQEDERQMISRELHDRIAQDLSTLLIGLNTLFDHQPNVIPEVRKKALEFSEILQGTIGAVRDLSYDLRLSGLEDMGLIPALSMYCEEFAEKSSLKVDFQSIGMSALRMDFDTEMNLYRLIQEGLNNIRRHAAAGQATVKLVGTYPNIILRIEDDGKGFDAEERARAAGSEKRMGLRSMSERVRLIQGEMRIRSQPRKGTQIFIKFPYQEKRDD